MIGIIERVRREMENHYEASCVVDLDGKKIRVVQSDKTCTSINDDTGELYLVLQLNAPQDPGPKNFWVTHGTRSGDLYSLLVKEGLIERSDRHLSLPGAHAVAVRLRPREEVSGKE